MVEWVRPIVSYKMKFALPKNNGQKLFKNLTVNKTGVWKYHELTQKITFKIKCHGV